MFTDQPTDEDDNRKTSRRTVLLGLGAGAAGTVIGGAGSAAAKNDDDNDDDNGDDGPDESATYVRGAHLVPTLPGVTGVIDGEDVFEDVMYGDVTDYVELDPGVHEFGVRAASMESRVYGARGALGPGAYTAAALMDPDDDSMAIPLLLQDDFGPRGERPEQASGQGRGQSDARLRFVHAAAGTDEVTVRTGGGRTLLEDVQFAQATEYARAPSGSRTIVVDDGSEHPPVEFTADLEDQHTYTAFALPDRDAVVVVEDSIGED